MQNDTWLTDTPHPDRCPLCSQSLPAGATNCPACGFAVHGSARASASRPDTPTSKQVNRSTPIPARASAQHVHLSPSTGASSRYLPANTSHAPESGWQHESPSYEAASSLSTLSLIIAEMPTVPPRAPQPLSDQIDEIDTTPIPLHANEPDLANSAETPLPPSLADHLFSAQASVSPADNPGTNQQQARTTPYPLRTLFPAFDEIDTLPEPGALATKELPPSAAPEAGEIVVDAPSWHAVPDSTSTRNARRTTSRSRRRRTRLTLLDRVRWWLVRPGHIEAVLRLLGGILLCALTFLLAVVIVLNLPGSVRGFFPTSTPSTSAGISTASSPTALPPTPTLSVPTTTAQASATPSASPTSAGAATPVEATATADQQNTHTSSAPSHMNASPALFMQLTHFDPLIWAIGLCYILSFLLLSIAALLRRRR